MADNERLSHVELNALSDVALQQLVVEQSYTIEDVQAYKQESHDVRLTNPVLGEQLALSAYRVAQLLPDPAPALGEWALGNAAIYLTQFERAITHLRRARTLYFEVNDANNAARVSVGLAGSLGVPRSRAMIAEAEEIVAQTVPVLTRLAQTDDRDRWRLVLLHSNFAAALSLVGAYGDAIQQHDYALKILQEQPELQGSTSAFCHLANRGWSQMQVNLLSAARADYNDAIAGFEQLGMPVFHARTLYQLATLEYKVGNYDDAEQRFSESYDLFLSVKSGLDGLPQFSEVAYEIAYLYLHRAENQLAREGVSEQVDAWLTEARSMFAENGRLLDEGHVLLIRSVAHQQRNEWEAARNQLISAEKISQQYDGHLLAWQIRYQNAQIALGENDNDQAIQYLYDTLDQIEQEREKLIIEEQRTAIIQNKLSVYTELADLLLENGSADEALAVLERARTRVLVERLGNRLAQDVEELADQVDQQIDEEDQDSERVREITAQIQQLMEALAKAQRGFYEASGGDLSSNENRLAAATQEMIAIRQTMGINREIMHCVREIQYEQPRFARFSMIAPVSIHTICQAVPVETCLLFYQIVGDSVYGFVLDHTGLIAHQCVCSAEYVHAQIEQFDSQRRQLWQLLATSFPLTPPFVQLLLNEPNDILQALHTVLIRPFAEQISTVSHLVIIPDGDLFSVPFQALYDGERYLIEQKMVSYCPSLTFLHLCQLQTQTNNHDDPHVLALGYDGADRSNRLAHVYDEIEMIANLFERTVTHTQKAATASWFLDHADQFDLIHIGSHAAFLPTDPQLSFIALSDRDLISAEIAGLNLNAGLVTLSGCETARTESGGSEFVSISGAFAAAGVPSLLVTQWIVGDQVTTELMHFFYMALLRGESVGYALQYAQTALLSSARESHARGDTAIYCHPALWSPFIVIGDWTKSFLSEKENRNGN